MALSVTERYARYYDGDRARAGLFHALAAWNRPKRVLYPGGFIHVTASFVFPSVTYVDMDRQAARFFADLDAVHAFVDQHKVYEGPCQIAFHGQSYEDPLSEDDGSFDLLLSLYAGFISAPCKRYLAVGGVLAANNSHGDAGLASVDPDFEFIGVVRGRGDALKVDTEALDRWLKPKRDIEVTEALLRERGRGIGYTKTATAYLFRRVR